MEIFLTMYLFIYYRIHGLITDTDQHIIKSIFTYIRINKCEHKGLDMKMLALKMFEISVFTVEDIFNNSIILNKKKSLTWINCK